MEQKNNAVILIPALNPDEKMVRLVNELKDNGFENIIIVNDGSEKKYEQYFERTRENGAIVLKHCVNLGKGRALKTGFNEFLNSFGYLKGVITVDADGQHKLEDIKQINEKLLKNSNKLILGSRNFDGENVPFRSKFGNKITRSIFSFLTGVKVQDTQTGLRGIPTEYITKLMNIPGERFEYEMNMLMETKKNGIEIIEEDISTIYEENNKSSHFNPLVDSYRIYMIFFKYMMSSLISFIVDIGLYKIIFEIFKNIAGIYVIAISTIGARIVSSFVNYKINKNTVFRTSNKSSIIKYYILCIIQMLVSAGGVSYVYNLVGEKNEILIKIIVDIILFFVNFKIQKEWVFRREKNK